MAFGLACLFFSVLCRLFLTFILYVVCLISYIVYRISYIIYHIVYRILLTSDRALSEHTQNSYKFSVLHYFKILRILTYSFLQAKTPKVENPSTPQIQSAHRATSHIRRISRHYHHHHHHSFAQFKTLDPSRRFYKEGQKIFR